MTASTIGNGSPNAQAESPATVAATSEIAMLPSSESEMASIDSSRIGRQRRLGFGGANPNSQSVIVGPLHEQEQRQERQRDQRQHRAEHPAGDSQQGVGRVGQALGQVLERRAHRVLGARCWSACRTRPSGSAGPSTGAARSTKSVIWSHSGPTVTTTIRNTATNNPANTTSAARPRGQPRRTRRLTTGSRPSASTPATKIDSSDPSDTMASPTAAATPTAISIVRRPMLTSTR